MKDIKSTPLHIAVENRDINAVNRLIAEGVDVNAQDEELFTPLHAAIDYGEYGNPLL